MVCDNSARKIEHVQAEIEAALRHLQGVNLPAELQGLRHLLPSGMTPKVCLQRKSRRKIRCDADASCWDPVAGDCEVVVYFEPGGIAKPVEKDAAAGTQVDESTTVVEQPVRDIVTALDAAQRDARFRDFVGLKPFRDHYLGRLSYPWCQSMTERQKAISKAIESGFIVIRRVANPKSPEFPTTAIELNREHPAVKSVLDSTKVERSVFRPLPIRGELLSSTVIAERR